MNTELVYKVFSRGKAGQLSSVMFDLREDGYDVLCKVYRKKVYNRPKLKNSLFFCFKNTNYAEAFRHRHSSEEIWLCEARGVTTLSHCVDTFAPPFVFIDFWNGLNVYKRNTPPGTIGAKAIKLIKRVA